MVDITTALPLLMVLVLFAGAGIGSRSVMLSAGGVLMVLGYVAVRSGDSMFLGFYAVIAFFMVMGSAVFMSRLVMGDTS